MADISLDLLQRGTKPVYQLSRIGYTHHLPPVILICVKVYLKLPEESFYSFMIILEKR